MKNIAVISDVHGCFKTLMALVAKIPAGYEVVLCGDLIDRGPDSAGVVKWAIDNGIRTVIGNHEDLMLWHYARVHDGMPYTDRNIWMWNGGGMALQSWSGRVPEYVLDWVESLPFNIREGNFDISHTGYGGLAKANRMTKLWARYGSDVHHFPDDGMFRIFGHTQKQEPWLEKSFAMIDTGCAYKDRGMGVLTAYLIPDKKIIQQVNID